MSTISSRVGARRVRAGRVGGDQDPGRAEAALERVVLPEGLLQRVELAVAREPPRRSRTVGAVDLRGEQEARAHGDAVQAHRAGAADAVLAADVRPGQPDRVAQEVGQQRAAAPPPRGLAVPLTVTSICDHAPPSARARGARPTSAVTSSRGSARGRRGSTRADRFAPRRRPAAAADASWGRPGRPSAAWAGGDRADRRRGRTTPSPSRRPRGAIAQGEVPAPLCELARTRSPRPGPGAARSSRR